MDKCLVVFEVIPRGKSLLQDLPHENLIISQYIKAGKYAFKGKFSIFQSIENR